jgi:hypothetical protein
MIIGSLIIGIALLGCLLKRKTKLSEQQDVKIKLDDDESLIQSDRNFSSEN